LNRYLRNATLECENAEHHDTQKEVLPPNLYVIINLFLWRGGGVKEQRTSFLRWKISGVFTGTRNTVDGGLWKGETNITREKI
jgi:hypothetical protein